MTAYVAGFLVCPEEDSVVLVRKNRPAWQRGLLNGVGGHIEQGETPHEAMVREFHEETDLLVPKWDPLTFITWPGEGEVRGEKGGAGAIVWFFKRHAPPEMLQGVRTNTDETIEVLDIGTLLSYHRKELVPNLRWLLPLAAYTADEYEPFAVEAQVAEAV